MLQISLIRQAYEMIAPCHFKKEEFQLFLYVKILDYGWLKDNRKFLKPMISYGFSRSIWNSFARVSFSKS